MKNSFSNSPIDGKSSESELASLNLFDRLLTINDDAFNAGYFDISYHILESAFYCAEILEDDQYLITVSNIAKRQLSYIDEHHPDYRHSTPSSTMRQQNSIFLKLVDRVNKKISLRNIDRKVLQIKNGL